MRPQPAKWLMGPVLLAWMGFFAPSPAEADPQQTLQVAGDPTPASQPSPKLAVATDEPPSNWYVLQPGIWPEADRFIGLLQIGLIESRSDRFYGLAQVSFGASQAREAYALVQLGLYRTITTEALYGPLAWSLYWNDAELMAGGVQLAPRNSARRFIGIGQIGAYNLVGGPLDENSWKESEQEKIRFIGLLQLGAFNKVNIGSFVGLARIGGVNVIVGKNLVTVAQIGLWNYVHNTFYGALDIGVVNLAWDHNALLQAGAFNGLRNFRGALQVGAANYTLEDWSGLLQVGVANIVGDELAGAQLGAFNYARDTKGVQIGVVNYTQSLKGVQVGVVNIARSGGLPVSPAFNIGF